METYLFFYYLHDYQSSHCQLLYFSICQNMKQQHQDYSTEKDPPEMFLRFLGNNFLNFTKLIR